MKIRPKSVTMILISALLFGVFLTNERSYGQTKALTPMPTNVNVVDRTGTELTTYYSGINGTKGDALLASLNPIIDGHNEYSYKSDTHRTIYKIIDRNWDLSPLTPTELQNFNYAADEETTYIRKFYADYNDDISRADVFKATGAARVSFDKEHLWAQSLGDFGRDGGAGSDFHSLVPSDIIGNQNLHSNYNFATPTSSISTYNNDKGTYVGINGYIPGSSSKVMEPLDQYKGDIARAMFYMPARYYYYEDVLHPKLTLVNGSPDALTASPTQAGLAGDLATLLAWHELDPVDEYEIHRNNLIYNNYQGNRNPFIDFPELAKIAYDTSYTGSGAAISSSSACTITSCTYYDQNVAELSYISITEPASKIDYYVGAELSTAGLELTAHYSDTTTSIASGFVTSITGETGTTFTTSGEKVVNVSYTEGGITKSTQYVVYVASTATLTANPVVTSIPLGGNYSDSGLTATINYTTTHGQFSDTIPFSSLTIGTPNTMLLGAQPVSVGYLGYTTTFNLTITNVGATVVEVVTASDLFFSEYIEGTSNNKALEIYNGTGSSVDLSNYSLVQYNNGATSPVYPNTLSGTLLNNSTYTIANASSVTALLSVANITSSSSLMGFNGNDAIALRKNGSIIDLIGEIGSAANFAIDITLVRKPAISQGSPTYVPSEWTSYPADTFTDIGSHTTNWISSGISTSQQARAYAEYFINITSPYCLTGTATNIPWIQLKNEYLAMTNGSKNVFFTSTDSTIINARARYTLLVNRYSIFAGENNFMVDGDGDHLVVGIKKLVTNKSNENLLFIITLGLGILSIGGYYFYRRRESKL